MAARTATPADPLAPQVCICCREPFEESESHCSACFAPRELSIPCDDIQQSKKFISVLGASGSGKTVFLSVLLDMLSNGEHGLKALPNNSFSVAAQTRTLAALQDRCFPDKTPSESDRWNWVHCELKREKSGHPVVNLITPDLAGEAIALELERPGSSPAIKELAVRSQAVVLLCDVMAICEDGVSQDHFALQMVAYLHAIKEQLDDSQAREFDLPIAIVFTKCDECRDVLEAPEEFAKNNMPRLVSYCDGAFPNHRFFAAGVAGALATIVDSHGRRVRVPLHTEPCGVLEPIEWIMSQKVMR